MFEWLFALYAYTPKHDENEYDVHLDKPNTTFPFEKYVANVGNKNAELNRKLRYLVWL
ncbi:hypothetical protein GCM10022388_21990 [Flavobacterium chungnamense]|uniref:Uncharacterized protein n=1 Tax=Flavobacterium chungnamense TaxID=706182 RepID=A0ABP7UXI6_9FLAO